MMTPPAITSPASQPAFDLARFLDCLAQVERVRKSHRRGEFGERGKYQFTEETWKSVTVIPFEEAENDATSDKVARFYITKLRYQLLERHFEPTVYMLALAFHRGLNGAILRGFQGQEVKDYCIRVENLYFDR